MSHPRSIVTFALPLLVAVLPAVHDSLLARSLPPPVCRMVLHEEQVELQDAQLELELARSGFAAYEEIFELIEGLWKNDAVERMVYLKAKYDRDAAKLALEGAERIVERQAALLEQYRMVCDGADAREGSEGKVGEIERAYLRYRRADCDAQAKAVEAAKVNLAFDREWLASILDLRAGEVATRQDVILAELDVEQEEKRLADAERRVEACRRELGVEARAESK